MIKRVLWIGPMYNAETLRTHRVPNQAATKWSWAILDALTRLGVHVEGISHCPEQLWPRGKKMWVSAKGWAIENHLVYGIGYINVPWIRERLLTYNYRRTLQQVITDNKSSMLSTVPFDAILGYNILHPQDITVAETAKRWGVPYFGFILDGDDPRRDQWRRFLQNTQYATGLAFLSYWMMQNYPGVLPTFHFDGGGGEWKGDRALQMREKNLIVYTGALDHWRGGDFLVEIIRQLKHQDVRIVLCGKCDRAKTWARFGNDPRVNVRGFVSEAEMDIWCCRASVFLNVRDPQNGDNVVNFPSKIPNYLAYGKPVVSTWLPSLDPVYQNVLEVVDEKDSAMFAMRIEYVLGQPDKYYQEKFTQIGTWYCNEKTWLRQTEKLLTWMNTTLPKGR